MSPKYLIVLALMLIIKNTSCLFVNHTSIVGFTFRNLSINQSFLLDNVNLTNTKPFFFNVDDELYLDVFTGIRISNMSIAKDLNISNCMFHTNLITNNQLDLKLVKNTSMISIIDSNIKGAISIKAVNISSLLNGKMINNNQTLITNIYIGNVFVGDSIRLDLKELTHSILIENVQVNGDLIIENGRLYVGTIIIKNSKILGKLIVQNIQVASKIKTDENVKADDIIICPLPFFRQYKGANFYGCYTYAGVIPYSETVAKCKSLGAQMVTIKRKEYLNDLPLFYSSFSPYYYHLGAKLNSTITKTYTWYDGTQVDPSFWCSGYPEGSTCTYTTQPLIGSTIRCIKSGACTGNWFDIGLVCQYFN